jgi:hypothetical protein
MNTTSVMLICRDHRGKLVRVRMDWAMAWEWVRLLRILEPVRALNEVLYRL